MAERFQVVNTGCTILSAGWPNLLCQSSKWEGLTTLLVLACIIGIEDLKLLETEEQEEEIG